MERKKILYIHHGKGLGGAPLSLLYLIKNLDKTKYHPVVLFLYNSEMLQLYESNGIEVFGPVGLSDFPHTKIFNYKWYHFHLFLKSCLHYFYTIFRIADYWLDKIKPDLVHLNTSSLIAWARVAKKRGIPVVFHVREPLAKGYFGVRKFFVKKSVGKYSDVIMPICKNDAKPWFNFSKVQIVYNAVDSNKFDKNISENVFLSKYNLSKYSPKILFLGGLSQEKGTLVILQIFKKLLQFRPQVQLLIGSYFDLKISTHLSLKRYFPAQIYNVKIKKILDKVKNSIVFFGPINNVEEALAACDVLVFPSTVGHFARPIIEAGFMCKPVIAANLPPLDELVINGETGFLIDINNQEQWVEKLHALLTNKSLNKRIGEKAYKFCLKNFDINKQLDSVHQCYCKLLSL